MPQTKSVECVPSSSSSSSNTTTCKAHCKFKFNSAIDHQIDQQNSNRVSIVASCSPPSPPPPSSSSCVSRAPSGSSPSSAFPIFKHKTMQTLNATRGGESRQALVCDQNRLRENRNFDLSPCSAHSSPTHRHRSRWLGSSQGPPRIVSSSFRSFCSSPTPPPSLSSLLLIPLIIYASSSPSQVHAQGMHHQYFKVSPQPEVNVIEGGSVKLQCEVGNQRGPVQWAKDGFVLGYDRNIPGFPRYSMVGDANAGVHNLKIVDAKSDDNGEFQCQVGPGGKNYAPIRATSKVTVLVPPSSIEITSPLNGKSHAKNSSHVEIQEGRTVTIQCLVTGGKPAAQIKWFRKNIELRPDMGNKQETTTLTTIIDSNSIQETEAVVYTSKSTIVVSGNAEDNGVTYACEAVHPALLGRSMRKVVTVSVQYPPGQPEISGYVEGETLKVGDTLKLDCRARGGNPLAQLVWFRNDEQVDFSYTAVGGKYSVNTLDLKVEARDNNAVYRCVATSPIVERPMQKETRLQVYFNPAKVHINSVRDVRAGDVVSASCRTEPSNPAAQISWVVDGRAILSNYSKVEPVASLGGFTTTANISIEITNQDRNKKKLSCYAVNDKFDPPTFEEWELNVLYPPESIQIFGYDESKALQYDTVQRFTCVCSGGNPLCSTKWFKNDQEVTEGTQISVNGNTVRNELVFRVEPEDNGAVYRCTGDNSASKAVIKASTTVSVHFPPSKVTIKLTPKQPRANTQLDLLCETASSNPQSIVSWWRDGMMLNGHQDGIIDGLSGGKITRNILRLNVTSQDDESVITCQAKNHVLQQSVHDAITLNVQYAPEFVNPPLTQFDIVEGHSSTINQSAKANPATITYKWKREDDKEIGGGSRIVIAGPVLNMTKAARSDSGIYKLLATNELGTSETSVRINVQYQPIITKTTELVLIDEFSSANLECFVDSNPVNERVVSWQRRRNDSEMIAIGNEEDESYYNRMRSDVEILSSETQPFADGAKIKSSLLVVNASLQDSGTSFDCIANNGIGHEVKATLTLLVLHKPVIDRSIGKSASESGAAARLICRAQGTPNVTFSWKREGSIIESATESLSGKTKKTRNNKPTEGEKLAKYVVEETRQLDLITYQTVLIINDVSSLDYGGYECIARNDLGFDAFAINLNRTSRPDPPRMLRAVNVTSGSVTLRWIPGFDGGLGQVFRVRYRPIDSSGDDPSYMYRDVYPSNASTVMVGSLRDNTHYEFAVMASNEKGDSEFTPESVRAATLKESGITETEKIVSKGLSEAGADVPRFIVIGVLVGSVLLVINIVVVTCFVRRKRNRKRYEDESDGYSGGTDSKTTTSSKTTMELYDTNTNGTKPSTVSLNHMGLATKGINETSLSGGEDELISNSNKSEDRFSGQTTDYEMEIPQASMMTLDNHRHLTNTMLSNGHLHGSHHHHQQQQHAHHYGGMSTYLLDETISPDGGHHFPLSAPISSPHQYALSSSVRYSSLGSEMVPPTSFYNAIATEEDYLSALQHSGASTIMTSTGPISVVNAANGSVQFQTIGSDGNLTTNAMYGTVSDLHHHQPYMVGTDVTLLSTNVANGDVPNNELVPPLPPLRSIIPGSNSSMTTFLPAITEEPLITPIGHLV